MTYLDPVAGRARERAAATESDALLTSIPLAAEPNVAAIAGGESPTEAEHNLLVTKINALLAKLRTAGILVP